MRVGADALVEREIERDGLIEVQRFSELIFVAPFCVCGRVLIKLQ